MQILSPRWSVSFGTFTLGGTLKSEALEAAIKASAAAFQIPEKPDKEIRLCAACGMFDPAAEVETQHFLDGDGNTWVACGTRTIANTPNVALVEAEFRRAAVERFGPDWHLAKKSKLGYLRKKAKTDLAVRTPFRLSETGALFICLQTGAVVCVGHAGFLVARDLVGRAADLTRVDFSAPVTSLSTSLLAFLRTQEDAQIPWPTGTASLTRKRGDIKESCSVRQLSWATGSSDAAALLVNAWKPVKMEVQWGDGRKGMVGLTGCLDSVSWGGKIETSDPHPTIEFRLGALLQMNEAVRRAIAAHSPEGSPLLQEG